MQRFGVIAFLLLVLCTISIHAQRRFNTGLGRDIGSSASGLDRNAIDRTGNPIDTASVIDANTIPIGLSMWKIDPNFGDVLPIEVDTLMHQFFNSNTNSGTKGHYNHLGNLGSPRISRIFFEREDPHTYLFTTPFGFSRIPPAGLTYTNTLSPYTNLTYYKGGGNRFAEERFKAYFAVNVNKRAGFGFDTDYTYGRGYYEHQSTALLNGGLFGYYRGDKYQMHTYLSTDNLKMAENGGITDDRYITRPLDMAEGRKEYASNEIPVRLQKVWSHSIGYHTFLTHRYNVGFYREKTDTLQNDSVAHTKVFVPVTSFIHTLNADLQNRKYLSYDTRQAGTYYAHNYFGNDSTDLTHHISVRNLFALSLLEGFNKWAKAGLKAYVGYEYRNFELPDSISGSRIDIHRKTKVWNEHSLWVGGEMTKRQGNLLHYHLRGEFYTLGTDIGQLIADGKADLNFRLLHDTVRFEFGGHLKRLNPGFYYRHFHSNHYWWDNQLEKIWTTRLYGKLHIAHWGTTLTAGVENIKNYTYFQQVAIPMGADTDNPSYRDHAVVRQHSKNIQLLHASLEQKLQWGILHFDTEVTYQKTTQHDVLPLPDLNVYGNLYLKFALAKRVLNVEIGADARYFTSYMAPGYAIPINQFYNQAPETAIRIGNYPIVNVYANLHLKRTRFFLMMYHVNEGTGKANSFLVPHYPINPRIFRFGLSWNFFD